MANHASTACRHITDVKDASCHRASGTSYTYRLIYIPGIVQAKGLSLMDIAEWLAMLRRTKTRDLTSHTVPFSAAGEPSGPSQGEAHCAAHLEINPPALPTARAFLVLKHDWQRKPKELPTIARCV